MKNFTYVLDLCFRTIKFESTMKVSSLALLVSLLAATITSRAADITGMITLQGTPPAEVVIQPLLDDPTCGGLHTDTPTTHFYVVGKNGEFADVVVSLKDASGNAITGKSTGASAPSVVLDQQGCLYTPQILAIQTGQKLVVKNSDPCVHNVHVISKAGNTEHNDVQVPNGADLTYTFDKPEMFMKFQCDVHPWMFAWVTLFDSPYYAISGTDGKFVIKDVPPGTYTVVASHRKLGDQTQTVTVADKDVTANFTFQVK